MIKSILRNIRLRLGKFLIDKQTNERTNNNTVIKKILFIRKDGKIGDYIVSSFVFRELKNQNIFVGVVCTKNNASLFKDNPYIDQLHFVKKRSILDTIKCGLALRKFKYDVIIDPTVLLRNRDLLLIRLIKAKLNIGYLKNSYKVFNINIDNPNLHFSEIYKTALEKIGFININSEYDIPSDTLAKKEILQFIKENQLTNCITVNFFGNGSNRKFNDKKIISFLKFLNEKANLPIILLTYPEVTHKLKQLAKNFSNCFIYEDTQNIFHTIELIRASSLLISPDTATIHIAAGLNKPIIGFYSNDEENFTHWHPNSKNITHILRYKKSVNEINPEQIEPSWLTDTMLK